MLVDYLRYVAFNGRLRGLFSDGLNNYADPGDMTGQHLRFRPGYLERRFPWRQQSIIRDLYWESHFNDLYFEQLKEELGIFGGPDTLALGEKGMGEAPSTFKYKEVRAPELQVVIDIHPARWKPRYNEVRSYEEVEIVYRLAGPAVGNFGSGDQVFDRHQGPARRGTLCGVFRASDGRRFALTCAHVAGRNSQVLVESPRRMWKWDLPAWARRRELGIVVHAEVCGPLRKLGNVETKLDAALIAVGSATGRPGRASVNAQAVVKPITTILQEEPVQFRGGRRPRETLARIAAVTVRKSIDLFRDGQMYEVGDVLMLGHRYPMYTAQRVSRAGDSGAAVRQGYSSVGPSDHFNHWHGMIIGGDDTGAFATHAEHLWAWAAEAAGDMDIEFDFEV
jgi:hypothetical protein